MSPRSDEPPRRAPEARRGSSRDVPATTGRDRTTRDRTDRRGSTDGDGTERGRTGRTDGNGDGPERTRTARDRAARRGDDSGADPAPRGFGGIGEARAYTPRGRTMAERDQRTRSPRAGRTTDPFRPALQVLDGGRPADEPARRARRGEQSRAPGRDGITAPGADPGTDDHDHDYDYDYDYEHTPAERPAGERGRAERATGERTRAERIPAERGRTGDRERSGRERLTRDRDTDRKPARVTARGATRTARDDRGRKVAAAPAPRRIANARPPAASPARPASRPQVRTAPANRRPAPPVLPDPPKLASSTRRLRLGTVLALALFAAIGVRLVVLQVVESPASVRSLMEQRQNRLTQVILPAPRGSILDSTGAVLAQSVEARYIYADPELVENPQGAAAKLSPLLGIAPSRLASLMARKTRPGGGASRFEYLARGVDVAVADRIDAMNLKGVGEGRDERRDVPGADLAANLIGFTGEDHTGLAGLEARYDELLRGTDGKRIFETGNPNVEGAKLAKEIPGGFHQETPAQPGTSLQLTINRDLQFDVQKILSRHMKDVDATIGGAVVIDLPTGEVLAQASYPAYNAAKPFDYEPTDREDVPSSVVTDPGSSHKAFIFGAALQEGIITPASTLRVGPALKRGGYTFADTHPQKRGTEMTMPGLLAYSSNVGTILIADKLGPQKVYEYQQKFGLGQATGEGMREASGKILTPAEWSPSASGSVPIGMSVDATLIQMAAGYAAIANDGVYVQPHLIKATVDHDGVATPSPAPETHRVLSPEVAKQLRLMMEAVVGAKGGTGTQAAVENFRVAGKTGTGKRLVDGRYTSYNAGSFIGMAPADNPRFVIAVSADVPKGTGGDVAAPAFSEMMALALRHYHVPPTGAPKPTFKIYP